MFVFPPPPMVQEPVSNIAPPNSRTSVGKDDFVDYGRKPTVAKNPSYVVFGGQANSRKDISHEIEVNVSMI